MWIHCRWYRVVKGGYSRHFVTELKIRFGDWIWRCRGSNEEMQLAHMFPPSKNGL